MTFQPKTAPQPAPQSRRLSVPIDTPPLHDARTLTDGGQLAQINLDGQVYTLRITRAGKLILTK
ncbi:MAG: hemin uptake protein HemP [Pseudomonadota bacterium]